jgi:hypothetical protein
VDKVLWMTSYSKAPLRLAPVLGLASNGVSLLVALACLVYKLPFWQCFSLGIIPLVVDIFVCSSVQLDCPGTAGEYAGSIHTYDRHMPLAVEKERINFD